MNKDFSYRIINPIDDDARKTFDEQLNEDLELQEDDYDTVTAPLPENLQQFADQVEEWMIENWFVPQGLKKEDVHFPKAVRDVRLHKVLGVSENIGKSVFIDLKQIRTDIDDPDIQDLMAGRVILEEIYHYTGLRSFRVNITKYEDDQLEANIKDQNGGFAFIRNGEVLNVIEEGMAQLFAQSAQKFLQEKFPVASKKIGELKVSTNSTDENEEIAFLENGKPTWIHIHAKAAKLVKQIAEDLGPDKVLLERARITGRYLELARKLKEIYGESIFRKMILIATSEAENLTDTLQQQKLRKRDPVGG